MSRSRQFFAVETIEAEQEVYEQAIVEVATQLSEGEISEDEATARLFALAVAIIIIAFLDGKHDGDRQNLTVGETRLLLAAIALLDNAALEDLDTIADDRQDLMGNLLESALPINEVTQIDEGINAHEESARKMAIAAGVVTLAVIRKRLQLWLNKLSEWQSVGKTYNPDNPDLTWRRGGTVRGCSTCVGYDGQTKTAAEWRQIRETLGHSPRSITLECKGYRCQCFFN